MNKLNLDSDYLSVNVLRDQILPDILSDDLGVISYWAGKRLAQQTQIQTQADREAFFKKAQWGVLTLIKQTKKSYILSLTGPIVVQRLTELGDFHLEAGFIAASLSLEIQVRFEAIHFEMTKQQVVIRFEK